MLKDAHIRNGQRGFLSRRPVLAWALVAFSLCLFAGRAGTADAAILSVPVLPVSAHEGKSATEPLLIARKKRAGPRKRIRKKAQRRRKIRNRNVRKPAHNRPSRDKPDRNRPGKDKPDRDKPDRDRPNHDKTDRDDPKNTNTVDRTPDRRPTNLVCIGGRVKAGQCGCRNKTIRRHIGPRVFGCARVGRPLVLPVISQSAPIRPSATAAAATDQSSAGSVQPDFAPDEVLVTVNRTTLDSVDDAVAQSFGLEIVGRWIIDHIDARLVRYRIPDGRAVPQVVAAMQGDPRVVAPQPNYYYRPQAGEAKHLSADLQYALTKVDIASAHKLAHGRGARIAIIDSAIDGSHPDLEGAVEAAFDAVVEKAAPPDDHGTAIAGIIRARGQLRGIAPEARLLSVSVYETTGAKGAIAATTSNLLRGVDWALARRARVINMSLAGPHDALLERSIDAAYRERAIIVAAAGNAGAKAPPAYPAAYGQVIAVTATDVADRLYASANHGGYIAVAAPGVDILAPSLNHAHQLQTGTSFAAAHVSGIVALMIERDPALSVEAVRQALMKAAGDLGAPGRDNRFGAGRADAFRSLGLVDQTKQAER